MISSCQLDSFYRSAERPVYIERKVFEDTNDQRQCHSSTVVELANGDLMVAWWSGSFEGALDVVIRAARFIKKEGGWMPPVTIADIPDRFEGNPVLFSNPNGSVWLFFVAVKPDSGRLVQLRYQKSDDLGRKWSPIKDFITPLGIQTRNHPIVMKNGETLFPLFDQITGQSVFLVTGNSWRTWEMSEQVPSDVSSIQPTVIQRKDGSLYALMRSWSEDSAKRYLFQS